jgi:hypothetical protein
VTVAQICRSRPSIQRQGQRVCRETVFDRTNSKDAIMHDRNDVQTELQSLARSAQWRMSHFNFKYMAQAVCQKGRAQSTQPRSLDGNPLAHRTLVDLGSNKTHQSKTNLNQPQTFTCVGERCSRRTVRSNNRECTSCRSGHYHHKFYAFAPRAPICLTRGHDSGRPKLPRSR